MEVAADAHLHAEVAFEVAQQARRVVPFPVAVEVVVFRGQLDGQAAGAFGEPAVLVGVDGGVPAGLAELTLPRLGDRGGRGGAGGGRGDKREREKPHRPLQARQAGIVLSSLPPTTRRDKHLLQ
jgi:hypothetical protein